MIRQIRRDSLQVMHSAVDFDANKPILGAGLCTAEFLGPTESGVSTDECWSRDLSTERTSTRRQSLFSSSAEP
jgi:hypothetical protein